MTFIFVSIESLQPMLFQERFDIKPRNAGTENGNILLIDILVKCIFAPFVGILSDKIGRKIVL
jgi:nitrate/nitrite transporter NarK